MGGGCVYDVKSLHPPELEKLRIYITLYLILKHLHATHLNQCSFYSQMRLNSVVAYNDYILVLHPYPLESSMDYTRPTQELRNLP